MPYAYFAVLGRIILLGYERIAFKQAGEERDTFASAFWLFFLAGLLLTPLLLLVPFNPLVLLFVLPSGLVVRQPASSSCRLHASRHCSVPAI